MRFQWFTAAMAAFALSAVASDDAGPVPLTIGVSGPAQAKSLTSYGQIQFRQGQFREAAKTFASAIEFDPGNARAWWGLGRVAELEFHRDQARDLYAKAFRLDPRDTDVMLSYLEGVSDPEARGVLLRNVITVSRTLDPGRAALAAGRLEIERRLNGKPPARLAGAATAYRIPLAPFRPAGISQDGLTITVRMNDGKPLRLVLDSGARGILVDARAARNLGLEPLVSSEVGGFGGSANGGAQLTLARSLAIGDLRFEDCLIQVSQESIPGADGVLGTGIFEEFRMRIDPRAGILDMTPLPAEAPANTIGLHGLMFIRATVSGKDGWFLLDSGAAYSTISKEFVPPAYYRGASPDLVGVRGALSGAIRLAPTTLGIGGRNLVDMTPIMLDLSGFSSREGVEISGVLGYSALGRRPFTLDLRHGVFTFE
jgi:tetratricopeptide (TPR) repeat protein